MLFAVCAAGKGMKLFLKGLRCFTEKCASRSATSSPASTARSAAPRPSATGCSYAKSRRSSAYRACSSASSATMSEVRPRQGPTGENLFVMLERRLDNALYRMGLASSRSRARQMVLHGHVTVAGRKVSIPVVPGQRVGGNRPQGQMHQNAMVLEALNLAQSQNSVPWLEVDRAACKVACVALPRRQDVTTPPISERLIVEFYSRSKRVTDFSDSFFAPASTGRRMRTVWKGFQNLSVWRMSPKSLTDKFGRFSAQPFERGWGTTVGNALRRTLLSSIEGAAITAIRSKVCCTSSRRSPAWSRMPPIILNLKQVPLKLNSDQAKTIYLNVEHSGVVTSAMIEEDAVAPSSTKTFIRHTVSEGGKLQIEMRVKNGRGYSAPTATSTDAHRLQPRGLRPLPGAQGQLRCRGCAPRANDRLRSSPWKSGPTAPSRPEDAIGLASQAREGPHEHLHQLRGSSPGAADEISEPTNDPRLDHLDRSVQGAELSVRSYSCLKNANIQSIRELVQRSEPNAQNQEFRPQVAERD